MRTRALDAGGSQSRCAKSEVDIKVNPSVCMEIAPDSPEKSHIIKNNALDFVFRKAPCTSLEGRRFVKAEAMDQYTGKIMVCDNQEVKVLQEVTYINILYSLATDCVMRGVNDVEFKIVVCIPAAEYYDDVNDRINELKENLAGDTSVYFPMSDNTIRFHIDKANIGVVAEGVVAAYRFSNNRQFVLKVSMIVDVGYRSTDITILKAFEPVGAGAASRPIGGINLEANIRSQLERDNIFVETDAVRTALSTIYLIDNATNDLIDITSYIQKARLDAPDSYYNRTVELLNADGIVTSVGAVETADRTHYLMQGREVVDITEYVHTAKEYFVDFIYRAAVDVANAKMMNITEVSNVLCIGRPFSGNPNDEYNLVNMLKARFKDTVSMFVVPDPGNANVVEMIKLVESDEE